MNIENNHIRITTACFLGGSIGALLALQFASYFWWVGVLLGGGIGYLMYNIKEVGTMAQKVWSSMPEKGELLNKFIEYREQITSKILDSLLNFTVCLVVAVLGVAIVSSVFLIPFGALNVLAYYFPFPEDNSGLIFTPIIYVLGTIATTLTGFVFFMANVRHLKYKKNFFIKYGPLFVGVLLSPVAMFVTLPLTILSAVVWLLYKLCYFVPVLYKFICRTFKLIHSDIRLLCMTDSLIGATVGYFMGNALLGGLIGVVSGLLNYELISVRWLKLVVRNK